MVGCAANRRKRFFYLATQRPGGEEGRKLCVKGKKRKKGKSWNIPPQKANYGKTVNRRTYEYAESEGKLGKKNP